MKIKNLLLLPSDIASITSDGTMEGTLDINRMTQACIRAEIAASIPVIRDDLIKAQTHLSSDVEQTASYTKASMTSTTKNILAEVDLEDLLTNCTNGTELLAYLKENTKLVYIASCKSLMTNNAIDIYYHTVDKCMYVSPELSSAGTPPNLVAGLDIVLFRVAPLVLEDSLNSSSIFASNTKYFNNFNFSASAVDLTAGLAVAKSDVTTCVILAQGLNTYSTATEYSRNTTTGGTANQLGKDRPIHIVVLDELASNLLESNIIESAIVMQSTPTDWRLRRVSKSAINKIAFPIHI